MITGHAQFDAGTMARAETLFVKLWYQDTGSGVPAYAEGFEEPQLQVLSIKQRSGGEINTARIRLLLTDEEGTQVFRGEHWNEIVRVDDLVEICLIVWQPHGDWSEECVFVGFVANPTLQIEGRAEWVEFTVEGFEARLNDGAVAGQIVRTPAHDREVLDGSAPPTFVNGPDQNVTTIWRPGVINPEGQPNRTGRAATIRRENLPGGLTEEIFLFEATGRTHANALAQTWTLAQAVATYLYWWNDENYVLNPEFAELELVFGDRALAHIDLSGCRRLYSEILPKLLAGTPYTFTVDPRPIEAEGYKFCRLEFFDKNVGRGYAALHLDPPGGSIAETPWTNLRQLRLTRQTSAAATVITQAGDYGYHQGGFHYYAGDLELSDFIQAWQGKRIDQEYFDDAGDFINEEQFHERHDYNEENFTLNQYAACFRCFALNELGDYDTTLYNGGQPRESYDFATLFGSDQYAVRRRRFDRTIEKRPASLGGYYQPRLFVSFDSGANWEQMPVGSFAVSTQECKITIIVPKLVDEEQDQGLYRGFTRTAEEDKDRQNHWLRAINQQTLILTLIASVADDRRISHRTSAPGAGATRFEREALFVEPLAYPSRRVLPGAENRVNLTSSVDEVSGGGDAMLRAVALLHLLQDGQMDGEPEVPGLNFGYRVGQQIRSIGGRDISLASNPTGWAAPRYPVIVGVEWVHEIGNQVTRIELDVAREG